MTLAVDSKNLILSHSLFLLAGRMNLTSMSVFISQKSKSCLVPFQKYESNGTGDYRRATKEERKAFGSPWIAIYRKGKKKVNAASS